MISLDHLLKDLFKCEGDEPPLQFNETKSVVYGDAFLQGQPVHFVGVKENTFLGVEQALIMAEKIIAIIDSQSKAPVLLLVDVAGQQLSMRDEWLGMQKYFGHLLETLACLRQQGNPTISLIYNQAVGGGFIAYGLMADTILALPHAQLAVMWLEGIAKVTKIELSRLEELSKTLPVFAPGATNFYQLGGLHDIVPLEGLAQRLTHEIAHVEIEDKRAELGFERGGRKLAYPIICAMENNKV